MNNLPLKVLKFGGSSVGTAAAVRSVADLVDGEAKSYRILVVVSALRGVTDLLEAYAGSRAPALLHQIRGRHVSMAEDLLTGVRKSTFLAGLETVVYELGRWRDAPRSACSDAILAAGERLSAPLLACALLERGVRAVAVDARPLIRVRENGCVDPGATETAIQKWYQHAPSSCIPIVTGFIAARPSGETVLLGRGGSDYSAALFAAALGAVKLDRWTDVDGIHTLDPRKHAHADRFVYLLQEDAATWNEASRLGMHRKSFEPVLQACIPVHVRSLDHPQGDGTLIFPRRLPVRVRRDARILWKRRGGAE